MKKRRYVVKFFDVNDEVFRHETISYGYNLAMGEAFEAFESEGHPYDEVIKVEVEVL